MKLCLREGGYERHCSPCGEEFGRTEAHPPVGFGDRKVQSHRQKMFTIVNVLGHGIIARDESSQKVSPQNTRKKQKRSAALSRLNAGDFLGGRIKSGF